MKWRSLKTHYGTSGKKRYGKMGAKIDIVSRELIKPSSPTPHYRKELKLSLLDQHVPFCFIPLLFFYQKQPPDQKKLDPSEASLHLKQSLSDTLTKFYPLAGKLNPPDHFSVDCDDSGALFVEAKVDADLSEAVQNAPHASFTQFLPFDPQLVANGSGDADNLLFATYRRNELLLAVQISWFACGGHAIGVCISHKLTDFASLVTLMNAWAATNRGEPECCISSVSQPNFDIGRHLFPPLEAVPSCIFPLNAEKGKITFKRFVFSKGKLAQLKELATSSSSSPVKDPTRVEVVTAFLWKQFIKIAGAKKSQASLFRVWHVVNLRSRMSSLAALSNHEFPFGNLAILTPASFSPSVSDESHEEEKDYGDLVRLVSNSIRMVNDDFILNIAVPLVKSLGTGGDMAAQQQEAQQPTTMVTSDWFFSSWCRYPTYEVDFGWGKPIAVCPVGTPDQPVVILTTTSSVEDGIDAWIAMLEDELDLIPEELLALLAATNCFSRQTDDMNG